MHQAMIFFFKVLQIFIIYESAKDIPWVLEDIFFLSNLIKPVSTVYFIIYRFSQG